MARAIRNITCIPGVGGQIRITNVGDNIKSGFNLPDGGQNFEVGKWEIRHEYINADVTHSGSNGAKKYKRTAVDFTFGAELPWDSTGNLGAFPEMAFLPVGGVEDDSSFQITFRLGDSAFYAGGAHLYYFCKEALLSNCRIICDARGEDVIRIVIEGQGSGLLFGYQGADEIFGG